MAGTGYDTSRTPPPGWYPDPWTAGAQRWWDGRGWTGHATAPTGGRPPPPLPGVVGSGLPGAGLPGAGLPAPGQAVPGPEQSLDDELRNGRMASSGLIFGAIAYATVFLVGVVMYHYLFHDVFNRLDQMSTADRAGSSSSVRPFGASSTSSGLSSPMLVASGVMELVQVGLLGVGAIFLGWFYKACQLARRAGLPARRTPGLATAGFIIPIVSLWWPYQSARDLFVPGDPRAGLVGRWWALWIATQLSGLVLLPASFAPLAVGIVVALGLGGLAAAAAMAARRVVEAVGEAHGELVAQALGR